MSAYSSIVVNGWTIYIHPLFDEQYQMLKRKVLLDKQKDPVGYVKKNNTKRFVAIKKLAYEVIPQDPTLAEYRQGSTLGDHHKHWFRAKFFQQYRLFFRFHKKSKTIIYAWAKQDRCATTQHVEVEAWMPTGLSFRDDESISTLERSRTDAYKVFGKMLNEGHPPDDWDLLLAESQNT